MNNLLMIIPARGGSKGIPNKNMALIGSHPLIEFTIKAAIQSGVSGRICLSTDDEKIRKFGMSSGIEAPFLRPSYLAQDDSSSIDVVAHALNWYEMNENFYPDSIILLQPTNPFRGPGNIKSAVVQFFSESGTSLISVNIVENHPCEFIIPNDAGFSYVMNPPKKPGRQNFPRVFYINGAIYLSKVSFFKQYFRLFDEKAQLYVMNREESLDIDEPDDLAYSNWIFSKNSMKINWV